MSYRHRVSEIWSFSVDIQRSLIAISTVLLLGNGVLMGTAMAVIVGRRGSPFAVSRVMAAYYVGKMVFAPIWERSPTRRGTDDWSSLLRAASVPWRLYRWHSLREPGRRSAFGHYTRCSLPRLFR